MAHAQSADPGIADGAKLTGSWTCSMEHEGDDLVVKMTGHTTYGRDGRYEATGLGIVHFDDPGDQVRWVATSSGWYAQTGVEVSYSDLEVFPRALPPLGFEDLPMSEVEDLYMAIVGGIVQQPDGPQTSTILELDSRNLMIKSDDSKHIWNCRRPAGGVR
ncbi:MAG: hypothetical protein AAF216_12440 [Pseudomonadota bacterium]